METVLLVIHLMVVAALVGLVLVQRSEGGALGIGGGGNFLASRGTGNVLTRTTTYLAIGFFATSIALTVLAKVNENSGSILDTIPPGQTGPATDTGNLLDLIGPLTPETPAATPDVLTPPADAVTPPAAVTPGAPVTETPAPVLTVPGAETPGTTPPAGDPATPATPAPLAVPN